MIQKQFNAFMEGWNVLDDVTTVANNRYFSVGQMILAQSVSGAGKYALAKAMKPDYSVNYTVRNQYAQPSRMTTVLGKVMTPNAAATLSKVARYGGVVLSVASVGATELQYNDGQIGNTERILNHAMTGGWFPRLGQLELHWDMVITGGYQAATGRSIFNDMGLGPQ